ncbi:MAG: hypothetical protein ACYC5N_03550, partial [Endomicrobiales bacterium]
FPKNKMKPKLSLLLLCLCLRINCLFAYDNERTHPYIITSRALDQILSYDIKGEYTEFKIYFNETPRDWDQLPPNPKKATLGTIEADVPITDTRYHFYNPINGNGGAGAFTATLDNALMYGKPLWNNAISKYISGQKDDAYYNLGKVIHLLEDMTSTAHVYNDAHIPPFLVAGETNAYEEWVKFCSPKLLLGGNGIAQPSDIDTNDPNRAYDSFFNEVAGATFNAAAIKGNLTRDENSPATGDLGELFVSTSSGAALTYLRYIDNNLVGIDEYWVLMSDQDEYYYDRALASNSWWPIQNGSELLNYTAMIDSISSPTQFYIEQPRKIKPLKVWDQYGQRWIDNPLPGYTIAWLWAGTDRFTATPNQTTKLLPLAVNYTAGLMKYFYDLVKEPKVKSVIITQNDKTIYNSLTDDKSDADEGSVEIRIIFNRSMTAQDIQFSKDDIKYPTKDAEWSSTEVSSDTLKVTAQILPTMAEGEYILEISAKDTYNRELDSDEDSSNDYQPGTDTIHHFNISIKPRVQSLLITQNGKAISEASEGPINFSITFNKSMSSGTASVSYYQTRDGPQFSTTFTGWTTTKVPNDTMNFQGTIGASTLAGQYTLEITAQDGMGNELDSDEDISNGYQPGADTLHNFIVGPQFTITIKPPVASVTRGDSVEHTIYIYNKNVPSSSIFRVNTGFSGIGWTSDIVVTLNGREYSIAAGSTRTLVFGIKNEYATNTTCDARIDVTAMGKDASGSTYNWSRTQHANDHPDDNYSVSDPRYLTDWLVDTENDIGILLSGNGDALGHLLGKFNVQTAAVKPDFSIVGEPDRSLSDLKLLLIGSGGLADNSSQVFKDRLAQFVADGGVVVCLTQPYGSDFSVLPGKIDGYGWSEDQACFVNAVYINDDSPVFSGQSDTTLDVSVDGFFTGYPDNAKVLLRRTANSMPALLEYSYGKGKVIAGTLFSDWGYSRNQCSVNESRLIADIISYAKYPESTIHEYKAGDTVSETLPITCPASIETGAEQVLARIYDPDGVL